ncbi:hypothetical protein BOTCAL_0067g00050 [Botryotinia calthae]|uniref:Uncharacterized protein n=1 Tax=Botryotinia calthae TaxID=38488 RepID=A0A4Y8DBR6_9HELO|nr:hypothetical protein BOTCAL_0067g00050 [Botryotinia calthae]
MCLDTLSKFSCTPSHDFHNTNPIHGYTICNTTECPLILRLSNSRSERARYPCPKGPHQFHIDTATDNRRNLCPVCTENAGDGVVEKEFEARRKKDLKEKQEIESKLENRRQIEFATQAEFAKQANLTKQPKLSRHPARARHEEPRKPKTPTRTPQPRGANRSPGETVARRYANRQLDKEKECREDENDRIQRQLEREFSTEKTQRGR